MHSAQSAQSAHKPVSDSTGRAWTLLLELLLQFIHYNLVASPRVSALSAIRAAVAATTCGTTLHHNGDCAIGSSASRLWGVPRLVVLL